MTQQLLTLISMIALYGFGASSCHSWIKSSKTFSANFLILPETVVIDRLESGETVRLSFKTKSPAFCKIHVYNKDGKSEPSKDQPKVHDCPAKETRTEFIEAISALSAAHLYSFEIQVWGRDNPNLIDRLEVSENGGESLGKELVIMRLDLPLRAAETHMAQASKKIDLQELKLALRHDYLCGPLGTDARHWLENEMGLKISELTSEGFATSSARAHPGSSERLQLDFNNYQNENRLQLYFSESGAKAHLSALQPAELYGMELQSALSYRFEGALFLSEKSETRSFDPSKPLMFKWNADNLAEVNYLHVQVGKPSQAGAFACYFDAKKGAAQIEPASKLLANLTAKQVYPLTITLYSAQIQLVADSSKTPWLIESYDWRTINMQSI